MERPDLCPRAARRSPCRGERGMLTPGLACTVPGSNWLMLRRAGGSRRRPTCHVQHDFHGQWPDHQHDDAAVEHRVLPLHAISFCDDAARVVALPFDTVTIGWNGGLPPSSVESFSGTRLWKMPASAPTVRDWTGKTCRPRRTGRSGSRRSRAARRGKAPHRRVARDRQVVPLADEAVAGQDDAVVARAREDAAVRG